MGASGLKQRVLPGSASSGLEVQRNCQAISASPECGLCFGNVRAAQEASLESRSLPKNKIIIALNIPEKLRLVEHIGNFNHFLRMVLINILSSSA